MSLVEGAGGLGQLASSGSDRSRVKAVTMVFRQCQRLSMRGRSRRPRRDQPAGEVQDAAQGFGFGSGQLPVK